MHDSLAPALARTQNQHLLLLAHLASFVALSLVAFQLNSPVAFYRFDGTFLLSVAVNQSHWMAPFGVFSMNPLEGNAGLWFPTAMQLIPGFAVGRLFGDELLPAVAFAWFGTEFFVSTLVLGRAIGLRWQASVVGAWVVALSICPFVVPTLASERIWGNPHLLTAISANALALSAFISIGRNSGFRDLLLSLAVLLLLAYIGFSQPITTVLAWPTFGFFALVSLFTVGSGTARNRRILTLFVIAIFLGFLFGKYLAGLFGYAKTTFFWGDLVPTAVGWRQQSFFLDYGSQVRWLGPFLWATALAGAITCFIRKTSTQVVALGFIGFVLAEMVIAMVVGAGSMPWRGPVPAYFDLFAFPLYACFIGVLLGGLARNQFAARAMVVLPWVVLVGWRAPYDIPLFRNQVPFPWPPHSTAITEKLKGEIGFGEGQPFRGRVVSIAGNDFSPDLSRIPFASQHNYDAMTAFFVGNDHRMYGLWYFGIPTLIENNQFSSPFFHLLTSHFLADPRIQHTRPQTTITRFDERIFRQLGVRFVLTDAPLQGRSPVQRYTVTEGRNQYLYEVLQPNVLGVTPTEATVAANAADAIGRLADQAFAFDKTAVMLDPLPEGTHLVQGKPERLLFYRDHAEISATSEGESLLVLPIEYSRCIESRLRDESAAGAPRLLRVNLSQLGILFMRKLRGTFDIRFSPLEHPGCRFDDLEDAKRFGLGDLDPIPCRSDRPACDSSGSP